MSQNYQDLTVLNYISIINVKNCKCVFIKLCIWWVQTRGETGIIRPSGVTCGEQASSPFSGHHVDSDCQYVLECSQVTLIWRTPRDCMAAQASVDSHTVALILVTTWKVHPWGPLFFPPINPPADLKPHPRVPSVIQTFMLCNILNGATAQSHPRFLSANTHVFMLCNITQYSLSSLLKENIPRDFLGRNPWLCHSFNLFYFITDLSDYYILCWLFPHVWHVIKQFKCTCVMSLMRDFQDWFLHWVTEL